MKIDYEIGDLVMFEDPDSSDEGRMLGIIIDIVSDEQMSDSLSSKEKDIFESILGSDDEYYVGLPSFTIHSCMCLVSWFPLSEEKSTKPLTLWVPCDYIKKVK